MIRVIEKKSFSEKKKNLFIISNEMQLLNAQEAKYFYKSENSIFVFLDYTKDVSALMKYRKSLECNQLVIVDFNNSNYITQDIELIKYLKKYIYENIFIAYFTIRTRQYLANLEHSNTILMDDGTYTLALHNELYNSVCNRQSSMLKTSTMRNQKDIIVIISYYKNIFLRRYAFFKAKLIQDLKNYKIDFFTIYNLPQYSNEVIIKNDYTFLRSRYPTYKDVALKEKFVYFLGQTLHKSLGLSSIDYKLYIIQIIDFYKNQNIKIKYIPHRSESLDYKNVIHSLESDNFHIINIDKPFELYLLEEKVFPFSVASFYSSALFTSKHLFPSLIVESFIFKFNIKSREEIALIYKAIEKENIKLIKIRG